MLDSGHKHRDRIGSVDAVWIWSFIISAHGGSDIRRPLLWKDNLLPVIAKETQETDTTCLESMIKNLLDSSTWR